VIGCWVSHGESDKQCVRDIEHTYRKYRPSLHVQSISCLQSLAAATAAAEPLHGHSASYSHCLLTCYSAFL